MSGALGIGALARRTGYAPSAIRFYERSGVLPAPERVGGRRRYGPEAVRRLERLAVLKRAGFSLEEAGSVLRAGDTGRLRPLARHRLAVERAEAERAAARRAWLAAAAGCGCRTLDACPLFDG